VALIRRWLRAVQCGRNGAQFGIRVFLCVLHP